MADADGAAGNRRKRRCVTNKSVMPSAVHYVGYVEDDETPEAIMKKFEAMEMVMNAQAGPSKPEKENDGEVDDEEVVAEEAEDGLTGLSDLQLLEVFKQTSIFNVRSAMGGNEVLMGGDPESRTENEQYWSDDDWSDDEADWDTLKGFWSDEEDDDAFQRKGKGRGRGGKGKARMGGVISRGQGHAKAKHDTVTHYNAITQALIRRKVRVVDKDALVQIRIPPNPIPLSWGRTVQPYIPKGLRHLRAAAVPAVEPAAAKENSVPASGNLPESSTAATAKALLKEVTYLEEASVLAADFKKLFTKPFQGVLINQGWERDSEGQPASEELCAQQLAKLPVPKLCPVGFIFAWAEKEHIALMVKQMYKWGYVYVENLTWVTMHPNNSIALKPSAYARRSHLTLFIFRKDGEGRDIELRHQRNPDVTFQAVRSIPGHAEAAPDDAFVAIETLLPTGKGKFLELWAPKDVRRPGWTHLAEAV